MPISFGRHRADDDARSVQVQISKFVIFLSSGIPGDMKVTSSFGGAEFARLKLER